MLKLSVPCPSPTRIQCGGTRQLTLLDEPHEWVTYDKGKTWEGPSALHKVRLQYNAWKPGCMSWSTGGVLLCPHCGGELSYKNECGASLLTSALVVR